MEISWWSLNLILSQVSGKIVLLIDMIKLQKFCTNVTLWPLSMPQTQLFSFQSQILLNARSMIRFDSMESTDPEVPFCKRDGIPDKSRRLSGLESLNNCPSMKSQLLLLLLYCFSSQRHSLTMVHYMGHCDRKFFISSNLTDRLIGGNFIQLKSKVD